MAVEEFDQLTFTLKSGRTLICYLEKTKAKKLGGELLEKLTSSRNRKPLPGFESEPDVVRIDGWINTPLVLSVIHMIDMQEVASITILDAPKFCYTIDPPEGEELAEASPQPGSEKGAVQ